MNKGNSNAVAVLTPMSTIEPEKLLWLWPGKIPLGKLTMLSGVQGTGKSLICADIVTWDRREWDWRGSQRHK